MGTKLGTSLSDAQEAKILRMAKYYLRLSDMVKHYKDPETAKVATEKYNSYVTNETLKKLYAYAWKTMPDVYADAMKEEKAKERIAHWVRNYVLQIWNVSISDTDASRIADAIISEAKKI